MSEQRPTLRMNLNGYNPTIISRAFEQITETLNQHFATRTRNLFVIDAPKNSFDKCSDCVWFHKTSRFCAVAPQNLTSFECDDRQLPESPTNLDYLEARSPEMVMLLQELAEKLEIDIDTLQRKLYQGWVKHPEAFGITTRGVLIEIEKYGGYSITQMEVIGDGIRFNSDAVSGMVASAIRKKILAGQSFEGIMRWLLLTNCD